MWYDTTMLANISEEQNERFAEIKARWEAGAINPNCPTAQEQEAMDAFKYNASEDMEFLINLLEDVL
jgi:hypothetical protein